MEKLVLGPLSNNVYILSDVQSRSAAIIDPSFEPEKLVTFLRAKHLAPSQIWITHAHFDHTAGAAALSRAYLPPLRIGVHPDSFAWAGSQPASAAWGLASEPLPRMDMPLRQRQLLSLETDGAQPVAEVREAPGHCPGSVIFYMAQLKIAFVGDVIFRESIGRTDLPGGSLATLLESIRTQIFSLPDETKLLPGHGPESSVGFEKKHNPYLA